MPTKIVTAGYGEKHRSWAARVAQRANHLAEETDNGIGAIDLSDVVPWNELAMPHHCKFQLWKLVPNDVDRIIWVDTDTYQVRAITEDELPEANFAAVKDRWQLVGKQGYKHKQLTRDRNVFRTYPRYFNSGVMVATRQTIPAFDFGASILDKFTHYRFYDQDHFNYAVWQVLGNGDDDPGWYELDNKYNNLEPRNRKPDPVILHWTGPNRQEALLNARYERTKS